MVLQIVNECKKLPPFALWHIRKAHQWIPPLDLVGINHILLRDKISYLSVINSDKQLIKAHQENFSICGFYTFGTENHQPFITLFLDDIFLPIPYFAKFSPIPTLLIAQALAHEVGHHLVSTRGYIFTLDEKYPVYTKRPAYEEEMVNRYAFNVVDKMKKKLLYRVSAHLMNYLSDCYYGMAAARWEAKRYKDASDYWYKSFLLNSERQETIEWLWHSKEKLKEKEIVR